MGSLQVQLDQMFLLLQKNCENVDVNQPTPKRATRKKKKQSTPSSSDVSMNLSNASSTSESRHIASPEKTKRRSKLQPTKLQLDNTAADRNADIQKATSQHIPPLHETLTKPIRRAFNTTKQAPLTKQSRIK